MNTKKKQTCLEWDLEIIKLTKRVTRLCLNLLDQIKTKLKHLTVPPARLSPSKKKSIYFGASSVGVRFAKNAYLNLGLSQVVVLTKMEKDCEETYANFVIASFWLEICCYKHSHLLLLKTTNRKK